MQNHPKKFLAKFSFDPTYVGEVAFWRKCPQTTIFSDKSDGTTPVYVKLQYTQHQCTGNIHQNNDKEYFYRERMLHAHFILTL